MSATARPRPAMRFIGRSYMAFVFSPEVPLVDWLGDLDAWLERSPGFFAGRSIVLDLSATTLSRPGITHLIGSLGERNIRVLGLEGVDASDLGPDLPPLLTGGRSGQVTEVAPPAPDIAPAPIPASEAAAAREAAAAAMPTAPAAPKGPTSLLLEQPVRSGQSVVFTEGDITVLGSVGSGAEIVAGGSIHVYGTLRGRAMAGATGNPKARIFCHRIEAELLAIDGYYRTADEIDLKLRSGPTQAWLERGQMMITPLH